MRIPSHLVLNLFTRIICTRSRTPRATIYCTEEIILKSHLKCTSQHQGHLPLGGTFERHAIATTLDNTAQLLGSSSDLDTLNILHAKSSNR